MLLVKEANIYLNVKQHANLCQLLHITQIITNIENM
jgi:hypothetical protein